MPFVAFPLCCLFRISIVVNERDLTDPTCSLLCIPKADSERPITFEYSKYNSRDENEAVLQRWILGLSPDDVARDDDRPRTSLEFVPHPLRTAGG